METKVKMLNRSIEKLKDLLPSRKNTTYINFKDVDLEVEFDLNGDRRFPEDGFYCYINGIWINGIDVYTLLDTGTNIQEIIDIHLNNL